MNLPSSKHRIVVVGGGAGGLELATRLGDSLGKRGLADISLIDKNRTHVWKPKLHEIASGSMDLSAHAQTTPMRPDQLHVAIIGAGATGVELAAELCRTTRQMVAYGLDRIDAEKDIQVSLIEAADRVLPALPARMSEATVALLRKLGFDVHSSANAFARAMYLSPYKMHESALHGFVKVALDTLARLITRRTEPHVKLH